MEQSVDSTFIKLADATKFYNMGCKRGYNIKNGLGKVPLTYKRPLRNVWVKYLNISEVKGVRNGKRSASNVQQC